LTLRWGKRAVWQIVTRSRSIVEKPVARAALIVGSPVVKDSFRDSFKHFFGLIEPGTHAGKLALLTLLFRVLEAATPCQRLLER
jgi:hypothetical protein